MFFHRLGSDAEFIFGRISEFKPSPINAQMVVGVNKAITLASFIGTDGHASTAELRPRPAHNVRMHMLDIAAGLVMSADLLKVKKNYKDVVLLARPIIAGETMAGHIHVSFFVNEPSTRIAMEHGYIYNIQTQRLESINHNPGTTIGSGLAMESVSLVASLAEYAQKAYEGRILAPHTVASRLAWLLHPLELWLQPWYDRVSRNHSYGLGADIIRWNSPTQRPMWDRMDTLTYLHYEYRTPSTWLVHPAFAYVYLALAKVTMTNWKLINKLYTAQDEQDVSFMAMAPTPNNAVAGEIFFERLRMAEEAGLRLTRDVQWLKEALSICVQNREAWFASPTTAVNIAAWRALL